MQFMQPVSNILRQGLTTSAAVLLFTATLVLPAVAAANTAPTISGTPIKTATVGVKYAFVPTAYDADGDKLNFVVQNRPSWLGISYATGGLYGTPPTPGVWSNIIVYVKDGVYTRALPKFTITVVAATGTANRAPTISGSPATSLNAGSAYSFQPTAADLDGDTLAFTIANKPSWASFNTATGRISGTPDAAGVGSYANISIQVSDGKIAAALPAFAIAVNQVSLGAATLNWMPPTQNVDGTTLTNLAGYRIYYGTAPTALTQSVQVSNASVSTYIVENLAPATYYFSVRAYTATGIESANSNVASKSVQ
jgi:hypothetical protein